MFWAAAYFLHLPAPFLCGYLTLAFVNLSVLLPSSPGYVGVFHAAALFALTPFGVPADQALALALVCHAVPYVLVTVPGLGIAWRHRAAFAQWRDPASPPAG